MKKNLYIFLVSLKALAWNPRFLHSQFLSKFSPAPTYYLCFNLILLYFFLIMCVCVCSPTPRTHILSSCLCYICVLASPIYTDLYIYLYIYIVYIYMHIYNIHTYKN